ncbi:peptidoglycan-binding protein [Planotetraspora phitsanulokensis]|uniref:Peptidoglycan-binding protein n=1 Tax=Planotetraspora phitsanulokensis TaxID=575192 RepID=A0A8J3U1B8_9ACTN|nr:peptidoglycan-binding domain-containing protein [Planotetraspora phitsanulokensis]GII36077.1 peptidoglycan-binding protein [Planotetraspora phitsanulokensis]
MNRPIAVLAGVVVLAGAGGAWTVLRGDPAPAATPPTVTGTAEVVRTDIAQQQQVNGTLAYEGDYQVLGSGAVITQLPAIGSTITRGHALYEAAGRRVPLLYGSRPAWRTLALGMTDGADVRQLEVNLRALGYTGFTVDRHFSLATYYAVRRWQHDARLPVTGTVPLGQVVFLPVALRVTGYDVQLGASPRGPVLHGTSGLPIVSVQLDPAQAPSVKPGARVLVTLPDGSTRNGRVTTVSPVASTSDGPDGQAESSVPITIRLSGRPVNMLDQALVQVALTDDERKDVLAVPIVALLARPDGTFAVAVAGRLVPVQVGLFDESAGLVEVTGVTEGMNVEVPAG